MASNTRRYAVYYRVSTDNQDFGMQCHRINEWLGQQQDVGKIVEYKDFAYSGKNSRRPEYQRLLTHARKKKFDCLVVYKLDRLSRSANEAIQTMILLDSLGADFVSVTQPILTLSSDNPFRRTMLAMFAELAEIERELIRARIKDGLASAKAKGTKLGAPKKFSGDQIAIIKLLRAKGQSYREIQRLAGFKISVAQISYIVNGKFRLDDPVVSSSLQLNSTGYSRQF